MNATATSTAPRTSPQADLALLVEAAREAGALAARYFRDGARSWEKAPGDPVTEADLAVDALLHQRLLQARPHYAWLSEETVDNADRLVAERLFIVDPIDGTRAFVRGVPEFAVSVAVVDSGRPLAGVVYNPVTDELFEASCGGGARLNGAPIRVSARSELPGARMIGYRAMYEHKRWSTPWPRLDIAQVNSIAYTLALVACGAHDGSVTLSPKSDWDIAAAELIVAEAGGRATTHLDEGFVYNQPRPRHRNVIAAGPALHAALVDKLKEFSLPG
ncbi:inositol monophosphatase family protein [Zavarzinia sp. CC-PAN008]|uniref:inositol monophosphatase family protein n=1 Tax=Zavarzinia sp. CC-PAN008 TaxID=3243332 RepID=UPI003F7475F5